MNERIKDFFLLMVGLLIGGVFWLSIQYSALHERVKELYYRLFCIPYYKGQDKGQDYVRRTDR
jgi:hypothetical protein